MRRHPIIHALLSLKGNQKACVYTEPLWTVPHNIYVPFVSVYMAALLLSDQQIGIVASTLTLFQAVFAMLSGALTDKLGRKLCTLIFDILSWSVPCLLWAISQNFWWFMAAAAFNGMTQVTNNSWMCLLVEDAEPKTFVSMFSIIHITGQLAVIFAPIAGMMVDRMSVVPAMRILYGITCVSMTAKFIILYIYCDETAVGKVRMKETRNMSLFKIMSGYGTILKRIFASPDMKLSLTVVTLFAAANLITANFFGIYTTVNLGIPQYMLAYFPIIRSVITTLSIFLLQSRLNRINFAHPMLAGILLYIVSHAALILSPKGSIVSILVYVLLEALAISLIQPRRESMAVVLIEPSERARISGLITSLSMAITIPIGVFSGWLSNMDRRLPFLSNIIIFGLVFIVICVKRNVLNQKINNRE